jgi:hypothetical protein
MTHMRENYLHRNKFRISCQVIESADNGVSQVPWLTSGSSAEYLAVAILEVNPFHFRHALTTCKHRRRLEMDLRDWQHHGIVHFAFAKPDKNLEGVTGLARDTSHDLEKGFTSSAGGTDQVVLVYLLNSCT